MFPVAFNSGFDLDDNWVIWGIRIGKLWITWYSLQHMRYCFEVYYGKIPHE
jgi:hypothetical protein